MTIFLPALIVLALPDLLRLRSGLQFALFALIFLGSWFAQSLTGWTVFNQEQHVEKTTVPLHVRIE